MSEKMFQVLQASRKWIVLPLFLAMVIVIAHAVNAGSAGTTTTVDPATGLSSTSKGEAEILANAAAIEETFSDPYNRFESLGELLGHFDLQQQEILPIAPPDPDFLFFTERAVVKVFDPAGFPKEILAQLIPEPYNNGAYVYRVTVFEDPVTRERIFYNGKGVEIGREPPPVDYNPYAFLQKTEPWALTADTPEADYLRALWNPARLACEFYLLPSNSLPTYALATAINEYKSTPVVAKSLVRTMAFISGLSYPAISAFKYHWGTNPAQIEVSLPSGYTNTLWLFSKTNMLVPGWATLGATNTANITNLFVWVDTNASANSIYFYTVSTNQNFGAIPPSVSGTIYYDGFQTGTVWVVAVTSYGSWDTNNAVRLSIPGAYKIPNLTGTNYYVKAWIDSNGDGTWNTPEALGGVGTPGSPLCITNQVTGANITLADPLDSDGSGLPDWWELFYFGTLGVNPNADPDSDGFTNLQEYDDDTNPTNALSRPWSIAGTISYSGPQTGTIHIVASASFSDWTTNASTTLASPGSYTIPNLPPNLNYTVQAYRDSTGGGTNVFWFAQGVYSNNPVALNTNIANVNISLADPTNPGDGLPEWWSVLYGFDPFNPEVPDVAWWKLDETNGITAADSSGNGNTGSLSNLSASAWTSGVVSNALTFNGTGFLQATDSPSLEPNYVSVELWVNTAQTLTSNNSAVFVSKQLTGGATGYQLSYQQGSLSFTFCSAGAYTLNYPCSFTNGVWYHVAGTYDGNWQRLYVNGILCASTNYSWGTTAYGYINQSNVAVRLGATPDATPTNFFAGVMDDVRIYGYGLASNEVYGAYQVGADSDGDGLSNWQEYMWGTNPLNPDTNGNGVPDAMELKYWGSPTGDTTGPDSNLDGISDAWAVTNGLNPVAGTGINGRNKLVAWWNFRNNLLQDITGTWPGPHYGLSSDYSDSDVISAYPDAQVSAVQLQSNTSYISIANGDMALSPQTNFSIAAWILPTQFGSGSGTIIGKGIYSPQNMSYTLTGNNATIQVYTNGYEILYTYTYSFNIWTNASGAPVTVSATTILPTGSWVHVAGVYDYAHSNLALYVNGTLAASQTCHALVTTNASSVYMGANPQIPAIHGYACYYGDMRFFASALSASEVAGMNQCNQITPGGETELQAYQNNHPGSGVADATISVSVTNATGYLQTWCHDANGQFHHSNDTRTVTFVLTPSCYVGSFVLTDSSGACGYFNAAQHGGTNTVNWRAYDTQFDTTLTGVWTFTPTLAYTSTCHAIFNHAENAITISTTPTTRNAYDNQQMTSTLSGPTDGTKFDYTITPGVSHGATFTNGQTTLSGAGNSVLLNPGNVVTNYTITGKCHLHSCGDSISSNQVTVVTPTVSVSPNPVIVATNMANSNLTYTVANYPPYSASNVNWTITPSSVPNGAQFTSSMYGTNRVTLTPGSIATSYVIKAQANYYNSSLVYTNSFDTSMLYVVSVNLVPDSNHDRVIDASDVTTNTFHFWINDDANSGDISSGNSDVPGQSGSSANYSSSTVCGRNDLLDFFPVWLDVSQVFTIFPTNSTTQIILKQADNAVKIVYTCLTKSQAGGYQINEDAFYGSTLCSYAYNADTVPVTSAGVVLPNNFLCQIAGNPNKGVLLVEGVATSSAPLVVEYWQNGQKVVSASMPMQTSTISDMYRWINLRGVTGGSVTVPTSTNQPPNYPDALCNGKQFVYTHGFMTSESCARSGASQVFKRLYHSGSRAMFTMVAWQGDVGTVPATCYHEDVRNAFAMASNYVAAVSQLPGQVYVGAHSLGNMLVSSAIVDYGLNPQNYFMFDAAVAVESYNGGVSNIVDMVPTAWTSYDPRLWASDWFKLFPGDARNNLTWQNRFGNIPQAVNYFSSGEDVLENNPSGTDLSLWSMMVNYAIAQLTDSGSGLNQVWIFQERSKGASFWNVADQNVDGGWVQNSCYSGLTLAQANALASSNSVLQTNAFFNPFVPSGLYTTNGSVIAASNNVRTELLAESIPAVSCPSGGNSVAYFGINNGAGSIDMMQNFENSDAVWPRQNSAWWHGDFKDVAYYYVYLLFDDVVTKGTLK